MILPELKKPSKLHYVFFSITVLWLLILSLALFLQQNQITALNQTIDDTESAGLIKSLQIRQIDLTEQLESVALVFSDEQSATSTLLQQLSDSVEQRFAQLEQQLQNAQLDLSEIFDRLKNLDEQNTHLAKRLQQAASPPRHTSAQPAKDTPKPQLPSPAFILLGAEMRGGERLLSIAPKANPNLSAACLIRVGETVDGWLLQGFDGREATFEKSGQAVKLTLQ